jgi:ribosome-associated heat shock protein Hsp15
MTRHHTQDSDHREAPGEHLRLDKWLWAARFFKTRSLAAEAIAGGRVQVNGERAKPARELKPGDEVHVRQGPFEKHVVVRALSARRGPASDAAMLYDETEESRRAREQLAERRRYEGLDYDPGRPTKKDRRELRRLKGRTGF